MNNKKLGNAFEKEICKLLAHRGFWVHFIVPDARGAQPFDIIAVKDGKAIAIDCKTCVANNFNINRLEDNQISSFEKWIACGNSDPVIAVKHDHKLYWIPYSMIQECKSVKLSELISDDDFKEI